MAVKCKLPSNAEIARHQERRAAMTDRTQDDALIARLRDFHWPWSESERQGTADRIEALIADRDAMAEALEPFAVACADCVDHDDPDGDTWEHAVGMNVRVSDYRRARESLAKHGGRL